MRGDEQLQGGFIVMTSLEDIVPADHPLRAIRAMVDTALEQMSPKLEALYASGGRPSIAPEYLLRAQLIQILYAIPSERRLVEQLRYQPAAALVRRPAPRSAALPRDQLSAVKQSCRSAYDETCRLSGCVRVSFAGGHHLHLAARACDP